MNIAQAKQQIKSAMTAYFSKDEFGGYRIPIEKQRPVFMIGPPGIGKTAIMEQIAAELGVGLVSYSMTHHTRQSALGLPYITEKEYGGKSYQVSEYTMSEIIGSVYDLMRDTGKTEGILFLDEINCVSETLAPCMLQFLQYKVFGQHRVPSGWILVTAGNPPEYNKSVRDFDIVTLDRLKRIEIEPDYETWKEYAYKKGVHASVMTYLAARKKDFYKIENAADGKHFVTARGWDDLSEMIKLYEENGLAVDEQLICQYLQDARISKDFAIYYDLFNKYRSDYQVEKILDGTVSESIVLRAEREKLERGKQSSSISPQAQRETRFMLEYLEEFRAAVMQSGSAQKDEFSIVRESFVQKVAELKGLAADGGRALENVFSFCEKAFADGDELLIFVTELTANYYSARFIGRYGCDRYYMHNKQLQFDQRQQEIIKRMDEIQWTV